MTQARAVAERQEALRAGTGDPLPMGAQRFRGRGSALRSGACASWSPCGASDPEVGEGDLRCRGVDAAATDKLGEVGRREHRFGVLTEGARRPDRCLRLVDSRPLHSAVNTHTRVEVEGVLRLRRREGRAVPHRCDPCPQSLGMGLISVELPFGPLRLKPNNSPASWSAGNECRHRHERFVGSLSGRDADGLGHRTQSCGSVLRHHAVVEFHATARLAMPLNSRAGFRTWQRSDWRTFGNLRPAMESTTGSSRFGISRPAADKAAVRRQTGLFSPCERRVRALLININQLTEPRATGACGLKEAGLWRNQRKGTA